MNRLSECGKKLDWSYVQDEYSEGESAKGDWD
jgi:hypothetical protein